LSCNESSSTSSSVGDEEEKCFCNKEGNLICEKAEPIKDPLLPVRTVSASTKSSPSDEEEAEEPIASPIPPTPTLYSIDGCFCDEKTNVLSRDDPDDQDKRFCNIDGNSICKESIKLPPMGIAVFKSSPIEEDESSNCFCDDKTNVLSCDDSDEEEKCFCKIDGNLVCEEPVNIATRICSVPESVPMEEEEEDDEANIPSLPDDCFCDTKTNVLSCDDSEDEDNCFCNEDGRLRCSRRPL